jgi:hypothetical protein
LAQAHRRGEIRLAGIVINACMEDSVRSLDGFLHLDGCDDIPLGIDLDATDYGGEPPYQRRLAEHGVRYASNAEAEDGVRLYRKILANAPEPVELVEIGFLQVVAALLQSEGDDISPKSGRELVREKVSKCWVMAGKWDADGEKENNFARKPRARRAGHLFCELCPVPITFLGWEIGVSVMTGGMLSHDDHLWQALNDFGSPEGRDSWDPMLAHLALIGDEEAAGYRCVRGKATVDAETGKNYFTDSENGTHCYVVKKDVDAYYEDKLNSLLRIKLTRGRGWTSK